MKTLLNAVDKHKQLIFDAERYIWANPETGYKEVKTSKYLEEKFIELGYDIVRAENIPGFYTILDTGIPGPEVLILAELDSVLCPTHPEADPNTGAVHSCGHHAQCASLLGIAAALKEDNALKGLCGKIKLCCVPAEELLEIDYRNDLMNKGIIKFYGGKPEFLSRGYFDTTDIAFMVHTSSDDNYFSREGAVGCMAKKITFKGKPSHGAAAWDGKNALYAATCGLNACNALRETFKEEDIIRFHPIITHGGDIVNGIPGEVTLESYVRGKSFNAIESANKKVNQALIGSALSLNNNIELFDKAGYAPLVNDQNMVKLAEEAIKQALPNEEYVHHNYYNCGSTDMGDLSTVLPVVHPYAPGAKGTCHGDDYYLVDPERACVNSAKWQLAMLYLLLKDNGAKALQIKKDFKPLFSTKEEYFKYLEKIESSGDRITYLENGRAKVKL